MDTPTKVFVVEDSPAVRDALVALLERVDGVSIAGDADNPRDAIAAILAAPPDVVLLDFQLIGGTALDVMTAVRHSLPDVVFIVLTSHTGVQYRRACLNAGAAWFLDKNHEFVRIPDIVRGLHAPQRCAQSSCRQH